MSNNGRPVKYRNTLARQRAIAGIRTVKELAGKVGVHPSTVSRWEIRRGLIPIEHSLRLSEIFGIPLDRLFERIEEIGEPA